MQMLRFIALACAIFVVTSQHAAAQTKPRTGAVTCSAAQLVLPDLNVLKLKDGEHVVGMLETEAGKLEARVSVKGGSVSDPDYYLSGKKLTETPDSKIPKPVRACLTKSQRSSASESWFATVPNLIVPPAEAAKRCIARVVGSGCDDTICCARACCGRACETWCAYI
jgi:hypothetical protein